jgi:deoxyribonuclease V
MIACVDVDYRGEQACSACVWFRGWTDAHSAGEAVVHLSRVEPYEPGQFYKRELPCLLAVLGAVTDPVDVVVVDGYVWLAEGNAPGLGAHLHHALGGRVPVIGVAKTLFASARKVARAVVRGGSQRPLFVTAVGIDPDDAARQVGSMAGPFRLPTLLKRVDWLCRNS